MDGDTPLSRGGSIATTVRALAGISRERSHAILQAFWVCAAVLCAGTFLLSLPARYDALLHPTPAIRAGYVALGFSLRFHAVYNLTLEVAVALVFFSVATFIAWHKRDDRAALAISLMLLIFGAALPGTIYALVSEQPIWTEPFSYLQAAGWFLALSFLCIFPDARFVPVWTRPLTVAAIVWTGGFFLVVGPLSETHRWLVVASFLIWAGFFALGALAQYIRYTSVSNEQQRQQTKWAVIGSVGALAGTGVAVAYHVAALALSTSDRQDGIFRFVAAALLSLATSLMPVAVGVAVLRYRLYDVDVLINRALVYGSLTGLLAVIYGIGVAVFAQAFQMFTRQGSTIAVALSTLLIAALVHPLRRRIQGGIDRHFYRMRYDAARTLAEFSATLHHHVNMDDLCEHLVAVVQETMRPTDATLWLRTHEPQEQHKEW